jgi:hypothetical protein
VQGVLPTLLRGAGGWVRHCRDSSLWIRSTPTLAGRGGWVAGGEPRHPPEVVGAYRLLLVDDLAVLGDGVPGEGHRRAGLGEVRHRRERRPHLLGGVPAPGGRVADMRADLDLYAGLGLPEAEEIREFLRTTAGAG